MPRTNESGSHLRIKELVVAKLKEWFDCGVPEFYDNGRELDIRCVTLQGTTIMVEIIWDASRVHFLDDTSIILMDDSEVKIVIASREVLEKQEFVRRYDKIVPIQRRGNHLLPGNMIDGSRLLEDNTRLETEVGPILKSLVYEAQSQSFRRSSNKTTDARLILGLGSNERNADALKDYCRAIRTQYENYADLEKKGITPIISPMSEFDLKRYFIPIEATNLSTRETDDAETLVKDWLRRPKETGLLILGDFGTGKSSLVADFACQLAQNFLDSKSTRIPLFISLRNLDKITKQSIMNALGNRILTNWDSIATLSNDGKLVVILDGFDEMTKQHDHARILQNLKTILDLFGGDNAKLVITCRTHFFRKDSEIWGDDTALMEELKETKNLRLLGIQGFTEKQIHDFLRLRTPNPRDAWEKIKRTYNLLDLCRLPLWIDMVVDSLPRLIDAKKDINAANLYEVYTGKWIEQEKWRSQQEVEQKKQLMEAIAFELFSAEESSIDSEQIKKIIRNEFKIDPAGESSKYFEYELTTCSFLNRDSEGNYAFMHKSFMEFFVAKAVTRSVSSQKRTYVDSKVLTPEIIFFCSMLLLDIQRNDFLWSLVDNSKAEKTEAAAILAGNAIKLLRSLKSDISNHDYSNTKIHNADLSRTEFGANFGHAVLSDVNFSRCTFSDDVFQESLLQDCVFDGSEFRGKTFAPKSMTSCSFKLSKFHGVGISSSKLTECQFARTTFSRCKINFTISSNCSFDDSRLLNNCTVNGKFDHSSWILSKSSDTDFSAIIATSGDFSGAQFTKVNFLGASFDNCLFSFGKFLKSKTERTDFTSCRFFQTLLISSPDVAKISGVPDQDAVDGKIEPVLQLDRSNSLAFCKLDQFIRNHRLPDDLELEVVEKYTQIRLKARAMTQVRECDIIAACLYWVCKRRGVPQHLHELGRSISGSWRSSTDTYNRLVLEGVLERIGGESLSYLTTLVSSFPVTSQANELATEIVDRARKDGLVRAPSVIAASALIIASVVYSQDMDKRALAAKAMVTPASINNCAKHMIREFRSLFSLKDIDSDVLLMRFIRKRRMK